MKARALLAPMLMLARSVLRIRSESRKAWIRARVAPRTPTPLLDRQASLRVVAARDMKAMPELTMGNAMHVLEDTSSLHRAIHSARHAVRDIGQVLVRKRVAVRRFQPGNTAQIRHKLPRLPRRRALVKVWEIVKPDTHRRWVRKHV